MNRDRRKALGLYIAKRKRVPAAQALLFGAVKASRWLRVSLGE